MLNSRRAEEMSRVHSLREFVDLTIHNLESIGHYGAKRLDSDIPEILCLSLMVEGISLYPEDTGKYGLSQNFVDVEVGRRYFKGKTDKGDTR